MNPGSFGIAVARPFSQAARSGSFSNEFSLERYTTGPPLDVIGAVVGLLTLLSARVLGLLVAGSPEDGCDRDEDEAPEQSP
jgi:hypothetical protein